MVQISVSALVKRWIHQHNRHRKRQGIGGVALMPRLNRARNNLLTLHN